jgi:hypothetical protein
LLAYTLNPKPFPTGRAIEPSLTSGRAAPHGKFTPSGSQGISSQRVAGDENPQWIED